MPTLDEPTRRRLDRLVTPAPRGAVPRIMARLAEAPPPLVDQPAQGSPSPVRHRAAARLLAGVLLAVVMLGQVWVVSAGQMTRWPTYGTYCCMLADGMLAGHVSLPVTPRPELLALPDPYDPGANAKFRVHDAVLYGGKYYLYWGPMPSLLLAAVKGATMQRAALVGDQYLVFAFTFGVAVLSALIVLRVRERLFPQQPWWTVTFGILVAGLAPPVLFLLARPSVYEVAIIGGQCFLLAGLYATILFFTGRHRRTRSVAWLVAAGGFCGAALACRVSLLFGVVGLGLLVAWRLWRISRARGAASPRFWGGALAFACPVAIAVALLGLYNWVRFGSFTEFGVQYQLAGINSRAIAKELFSPSRFLVPNLRRYLFESGDWRRVFPFVKASTHPTIQQQYSLPPHYLLEPVAGITWSIAFLWFAVVPVSGMLMSAALATWRGVTGRTTFRPAADARKVEPGSEPALSEGWLVITLLTVSLLGFAPALVILASTMRYLVDGIPCLVLLAAIGIWQLLRRLNDRPWLRRAVVGVAGVTCVTTVVLGLLLAVTGYYGHFGTCNPALYRAMTRWSV